MKSDRAYNFLNAIARFLRFNEEATEIALHEELMPKLKNREMLLTEIYEHCFGRGHPPRTLQDFAIETWESSVLARTVTLLAELDARFVQLYFDPKQLAVTHSWKQKQMALLLDRYSSQVLWEALKRSADATTRFNVYEELDRDDFLDTPVLFLKEEARAGKFSLVKQPAGLALIEERFLEKVLSSGIDLVKLSNEDFHSHI